MTKPPGSSRWKLRFHWCTVGSLRSGAKVVMFGAFRTSSSGGVRNEEGLIVGGASACGKPPAMVVFGTAAQPAVVVPPTVEEQLVLNPGTLPATAVTWNEEIGSKASP